MTLIYIYIYNHIILHISITRYTQYTNFMRQNHTLTSKSQVYFSCCVLQHQSFHPVPCQEQWRGADLSPRSETRSLGPRRLRPSKTKMWSSVHWNCEPCLDQVHDCFSPLIKTLQRCSHQGHGHDNAKEDLDDLFVGTKKYGLCALWSCEMWGSVAMRYTPT